MTLNFAGGWPDRPDAKIQRWPPFLHQRAWSGCRCNQTSGSDLGRRWSLWNDCQGMFILDLLLPDFLTLPHSQSRQLLHYTTYAYLRIPLQGVLLVEFNSHFVRKNRLPPPIFEPMTVFWPGLHQVALTNKSDVITCCYRGASHI